MIKAIAPEEPASPDVSPTSPWPFAVGEDGGPKTYDRITIRNVAPLLDRSALAACSSEIKVEATISVEQFEKARGFFNALPRPPAVEAAAAKLTSVGDLYGAIIEGMKAAYEKQVAERANASIEGDNLRQLTVRSVRDVLVTLPFPIHHALNRAGPTSLRPGETLVFSVSAKEVPAKRAYTDGLPVAGTPSWAKLVGPKHGLGLLSVAAYIHPRAGKPTAAFVRRMKRIRARALGMGLGIVAELARKLWGIGARFGCRGWTDFTLSTVRGQVPKWRANIEAKRAEYDHQVKLGVVILDRVLTPDANRRTLFLFGLIENALSSLGPTAPDVSS